MNDILTFSKSVNSFISSDKRSLLVQGTNQYKKHKAIIRLIDAKYQNAKILFRTNALKNLTDDAFIGLKKQPKSNELIKIGRNNYMFDTFTKSSTYAPAYIKFDVAIVYPIDYLLRASKDNPIKSLFNDYDIAKVFLITCTDHIDQDLKKFEKYIDDRAKYDAEDEDLEYHKRVLEHYKY